MEAKLEAPKTVKLSDYAPPDFLVETVALDFDLAESATVVRSILKLKRNPARQAGAPLVLDGQHLSCCRSPSTAAPSLRANTACITSA